MKNFKFLLGLILIAGLSFGCSSEPTLLEDEVVTKDKSGDSQRAAIPNPVLINPNGASANTTCYFNIIFLAEGFKSTEMSDFEDLADTARDAILEIEPFKGEEAHINFYRVNSPSTDSGIGEIQFTSTCTGANQGTNVSKNTYWRVHSNRIGLSRYLGMSQTARNLVETKYASYATNTYAYTIVITNTPNEWKASAEMPDITEYNNITNPQTSNMIVSRYDDGQYFEWLVQHEFGHSFGGLDDEYENDAENTYCAIDTYEWWFLPATPQGNIKTSSQTGWHEGARYESTGKWRSTDNSLMRDDYSATRYSPIQEEIMTDEFKDATGLCTPIDFWEEYYEYYCGVELNGNGIFTGTVYEFMQSSWYTTSNTYMFDLFYCEDYDEVNGWCNSIDPIKAETKWVIIP